MRQRYFIFPSWVHRREIVEWNTPNFDMTARRSPESGLLLVPLSHHAPIGNEPDGRHQDIEAHRDPAIDEGEGDGRGVAQERDISLAIISDRLRQFRAG